MPDIHQVKLSKQAEKDLLNLPENIISKLKLWVDSVKHEGLRATRKIPSYHDEPLRGKRKGQRSIRLNKAYRAFYKIDSASIIQFVTIIEVNKHVY